MTCFLRSNGRRGETWCLGVCSPPREGGNAEQLAMINQLIKACIFASTDPPLAAPLMLPAPCLPFPTQVSLSFLKCYWDQASVASCVHTLPLSTSLLCLPSATCCFPPVLPNRRAVGANITHVISDSQPYRPRCLLPHQTPPPEPGNRH